MNSWCTSWTTFALEPCLKCKNTCFPQLSVGWGKQVCWAWFSKWGNQGTFQTEHVSSHYTISSTMLVFRALQMLYIMFLACKDALKKYKNRYKNFRFEINSTNFYNYFYFSILLLFTNFLFFPLFPFLCIILKVFQA